MKSPKAYWNALMVWTPTDDELRAAAKWMLRWGRVSWDMLTVALILTMLYLAAEIGSAFLPGGAVQRVLGGGQ